MQARPKDPFELDVSVSLAEAKGAGEPLPASEGFKQPLAAHRNHFTLGRGEAG